VKRPPDSYCYVATTDRSVADACRHAGLARGKDSGDRETYFGFPGTSGDSYISVINDIGDYEPEQIQESVRSRGEAPRYDSLVSAAFMVDEGFLCTGDHLGIHTHYWKKDGKTFCSSDNVFLTGFITGSELSRESLWEYLFFLSPIRDRTWFDGVARLRPGRSIAYEARSHRVSERESYDPDSMLASDDGPGMIEAVRTFFEGAKRVIDGKRAAVSISAGSDSNTVLSCVRSMGMPFKAYSFGAPYMIETRHIARNAKRLGLDWELIDMSRIESTWRDRFRRSLIDTNGLANPYRTHYVDYYDSIPAESPLFEGVLGSELMKGELAPGSTVGIAHQASISSSRSPRDAVRGKFPDLPRKFTDEMAEYISDTHGGWLTDVDTDQGYRDFRSFALEYEPGGIMAGIILQGAKNHSTYQPFASPMILRAAFREGFGIKHDLNIRSDDCGPALIIRGEAKIVRETDPEIYNAMLIRGISFRESLDLPAWRLRPLKRIRNAVYKRINRKYLFAQVDNRTVFDETREYAQALAGRHPLIDDLLTGTRYHKEAATLGMILDVVRSGSDQA